MPITARYESLKDRVFVVTGGGQGLGRAYALEPEMTVIADEDGVLSLGGGIGGEPSGCTPRTANVFLECALFDPARTAATGRKLAVESDARYRFERGVDPASVLPGIEAEAADVGRFLGEEAVLIVKPRL